MSDGYFSKIMGFSTKYISDYEKDLETSDDTDYSEINFCEEQDKSVAEYDNICDFELNSSFDDIDDDDFENGFDFES